MSTKTFVHIALLIVLAGVVLTAALVVPKFVGEKETTGSRQPACDRTGEETPSPFDRCR